MTDTPASRLLVVPVQVDALVVDGPMPVDGPDMDFTTMPWHGVDRAHNVNTPNLAAFANSEPFSTQSMVLSQGTHLHWSLPDALTRGSSHPRRHLAPDRGLWSQYKVNDVHFTAVPNRWLVRRRGGTDHERIWLVESDHVWPRDEDTERHLAGDRAAITFPDPSAVDGQPPFFRLGRCRDLREPSDGGSCLAENGQPLTAAGFGDPSFAALYANCHSVFGMKDPWAADSQVTYEVLGFYDPGLGDSLADPLGELMASLTGLDDAALCKRLHRDDPGIGPPLSEEKRRDAIAALASDAFGWSFDPHQPPGRLICYGRVTVDPARDAELEPRDSDLPVVGLGHTGVEAVGALVADRVSADTSGQDRTKAERRLEALRLHTQLRDHALDIGSRFDEVRHNAQFDTAARTSLWQIKPPKTADTSKMETDNQPRRKRTADDLPPQIGHLLHLLNAAQHRHDVARAEIDSRRMRLFCDWQCWMIARYQRRARGGGFPVDVNRLRSLIGRDAEQLAQRIAEVGDLDPRAAVAESGTLAGDVRAASDRLARALDAAGAADPDVRGLRLQRSPGPRFVRPRDPVIALSHPLARETRRHGMDRRNGRSHPVVDQELTSNHLRDPDAARDLCNRIADAVDSDGLPGGISEQGKGTWNPFRLEWSVEVAPLTQADEAQGLALSSDLVTQHYTMTPDGHDLKERAQPSGSPRSAILRGRTILSPHARHILHDSIDDFVSRRKNETGEPVDTLLRARKAAEDLRPVTQSLGGFTAALAGLHKEMQHPVADPNGFPEDRELTQQVARALEGFRAPSPRPNEPFMPIRNGWMRLQTLRIVDNFGRHAMLHPGRIAAAETFTGPEADRRDTRWLPMAPRFAQPARLAVDWVSSLDDRVEMNDHASTSPIIGWVTVSHVDRGRLMVHDAGGTMLGSIGANGRWSPAAGAPDAPDLPGEIADPDLAAVVRWMSSRPAGDGDTPFMSVLTGALDAALDTTQPFEMDDDNARALLTGRPLAVVRCRIGLELLGLPSEGRRWTDIVARTSGAAPNTRRAERVRFPMRVGEGARRGDGVLGYWVESAPETPGAPPFRDGAFRTAAPDATGTHRDIREAEPLTIAAADDPVTLTMLFDPRGKLHVSCGILPTEVIAIPETHYRDRMGRIGFSHPVHSVLTPPGSLEIAVPEVGGGEWSWIAREGAAWREVPEGLRVRRQVVLANWPGKEGRDLWAALTDIGWLVPDALDTGRARLRPPKDIEDANGARDRMRAFGGARHVLTVLERIAEGIHRPLQEPRFDTPVMLREGWLRLRPRTNEEERET